MVISRRSCNCWVLAGSLLLTAANADNYWVPSGRSFDDRTGSAVESERELAASICDSCEAARRPDDDRFWLVVISVACAFPRTRRTERQPCDRPSVAGNTTDTERAVTTGPARSIALCNWLLRQHCCYTSMDDWWDHLRSRSCSDITCSEHTSSLKSCQCRFLCNPVRMHTNLFGSILPGRTLDSSDTAVVLWSSHSP